MKLNVQTSHPHIGCFGLWARFLLYDRLNFHFRCGTLKFYPWENLGTMMEAPLLLIAGDKADTLPFSQAAYDADNGPKELYLVKGATHVDMYDKEPFVSEAVVKLADFFNQYLR